MSLCRVFNFSYVKVLLSFALLIREDYAMQIN